jgi:hypothetical protein
MVLLPLAVALAIPVLVIAALRNRGPQAPATVMSEPAPERPARVVEAPVPPARQVPAPPASPGASAGVVPNQPAGGVPTQIKWTLDWANVRQDRALEAPVVRVLHPGVSVQVTDRQQGWWAVYLDGRLVGYVAGSVLGDQPPGVSRPDTAADGHE